MKLKIEMTCLRETKNTLVYVSVDENAAVRQLYVQKSEAKKLGDDKYPQELIVAIQEKSS